MTTRLSWTSFHESPPNFTSNIRTKLINWNSKTRIRNDMIRIELSYCILIIFIGTYILTLSLLNRHWYNILLAFGIGVLQMSFCHLFLLYCGITNSTSMSAWVCATGSEWTKIALQI